MKLSVRGTLLSAVLASAACESQSATGGLEGSDSGNGSIAQAARLDGSQGLALDASSDDEPAPVALPATASLFLTIDDMEGKNDLPHPAGAAFFWALGPIGNWFFASAGDDRDSSPHGDAFTDNIVPPRGASVSARHVQGSGRVNGTDLYVQLKHPSNGIVDLSPYLGISFWARLTSPTGRLVIALGDNRVFSSILTAESSNYPRFAQTVSASTNWQRFILLFDDFRQGSISGNGSTQPFTAGGVSTIDFVVGINGESFDLWIDDLSLLCRGVCAVNSF